MKRNRTYFGGGVVVPPEFFLDFFPPLWAFLPDLVEVVFLPPSAGLSVDPPPACAKDRLAPNSSVNAIVSSFFISLLQRGISFLESFNFCKELLRNILSREAEKRKTFLVGRKKSGPREAALGNDKYQLIWVMGLLPALESLLWTSCFSWFF